MNSCRNSCGRDSCPGDMAMDRCGRDRRMMFEDMPIAMAYVPWQMWRDLYPPDEAFHCGTIFKELNLPFTGRRVCK